MHQLDQLHAELGIPPEHTEERGLICFPECKELVEYTDEIDTKDHFLHPSAKQSWLDMRETARNDGITIYVISAFRSYEYQANIIRRKLKRGDRIEDILKINTAPGYSEHHTGKAIDIGTPGSEALSEEFERTAAFAWLQNNAARFSYRLSYPRNNPMGIIYEPWHWFFTG